MPAREIDVLIRGAGPVGCALALALEHSGLRVAILGRSEAKPPFRPIALSYASRLVLERLGAWPASLTPIETIHVSQQGGFGRMVMEAADAGVPALGYVKSTPRFSLLHHRCEAYFVETETAARCVVHAEGAAADAREKRYSQDALVALICTEPAATVSAFERFTQEGPLALLPLAGRYALIWSCRPERARALVECPEASFLHEMSAPPGGGRDARSGGARAGSTGA